MRRVWFGWVLATGWMISACGGSDDDVGQTTTGGSGNVDAGPDSASGGIGGIGGSVGAAGNAGSAGSGGATASCATGVPANYATPLGRCRDDGWCWESPVPSGEQPLDMWGASENDFWVLYEGYTAHFSAGAWSIVTSPTGTSIWGSAPDDVYLADGFEMHHFDGSAWSTTTLAKDVSHVHGTGPDNVWAVGLFGNAAHYDGSAWTIADWGGNGTLFDVATTGPNDVWILALQFVRRFDGTSYTDYTLAANGGNHRAIYAAAPNDVWVAADAASPNLPKLHRWNGTSFQDFPYDSFTPKQIAGNGTDDIWFLPGVLDFDHWDGTAMSTMDLGYSVADDLWMTGSTPWIAGYHSPPLKWTGSAWAGLGVTKEDLTAVSGTAWNDIWVVGTNGVVVHFDGSAWSVGTVGNTEALTAVWSGAPGDVWAGSLAGKLHHFTNGVWQQVFDGTYWIHGMSGVPGGNVWFSIGLDLNHWNGSSVDTLHPNVGGIIDIEVRSETDVWVTGLEGLARYDGSTWTKLQSLPLGPLFVRNDDEYIAILDKIHVFSNGTDHVWDSPVGELTSIWACGGTTWIGGREGVARFDGTSFEPFLVGELNAVWGASADHVVAVGPRGSILRYAK